MQAVTVAEAQRELPHLMELVNAGEDVVITRQGIPVARLVQTKPQPEEKGDLKCALAELADMRANQAMTPSSVELIREMREGQPGQPG